MLTLVHIMQEKRDYVIKRLRDMGFVIKYVPDSTFYLWLNLEGLPGPISDGLNFFQACLEEKVIVVPGIFFDLNPARRRDLFDSPCHHCKLLHRKLATWASALYEIHELTGRALQSSVSPMVQSWIF